MAPTFIHAGSRGGPLRPSGSSTVPTNVRPYRVGSGTLRVVVSIGCCRKAYAMSVIVVLVMMMKSVSGSPFLLTTCNFAAGRSDVHSGNNDCSGLARSGIHLREFSWQGLLLLQNMKMSCLFKTLRVK